MGQKMVHDFNRWERLLKIYSTIKDFTAGTGESSGGEYFEGDIRMRFLEIWHLTADRFKFGRFK